MKKLLPAFILAFAIGFMLYIFEPITMYATNINDFWFDFNMIIKSLLTGQIIVFITIGTLFIILYKVSKKDKLFNIVYMIIFAMFLAAYIEGNFLSGFLPALDGRQMTWNNLAAIIISSCIWILIFVISYTFYQKFGAEKVINASKYITLSVIVMLSTSLVTALMTTNILGRNETKYVPTVKNYNVASSNNNFFIFLLDAIDSVKFEEVMNGDEDFKNTFEDFTYYKDTLAGYPFTRDSIPLILSGKWNKNEEDFRTYYSKALDSSPFLEELVNRNYQTNIYDDELIWSSKKAKKVDNLEKLQKDVSTMTFLKEETKYDLFKYLPYILKRFSRIERMSFSRNRIEQNEKYFSWGNIDNYKKISKSKIKLKDKNYFQFLHIEGAHVPLNLNKEVKPITNGTYSQKIEACLTIINKYINRIKEAGIYDNSVIIVLSDHGYGYEGKGIISRQNPILFIKGTDEHHPMKYSEIPVSYEDLTDGYIKLLDGQKSDEIFNNLDSNRTRKFLWYEYLKENHMVEYEQKGRAWEEETMVKTGKEYNR